MPDPPASGERDENDTGPPPAPVQLQYEAPTSFWAEYDDAEDFASARRFGAVLRRRVLIGFGVPVASFGFVLILAGQACLGLVAIGVGACFLAFSGPAPDGDHGS